VLLIGIAPDFSLVAQQEEHLFPIRFSGQGGSKMERRVQISLFTRLKSGAILIDTKTFDHRLSTELFRLRFLLKLTFRTLFRNVSGIFST